MIFTITGNTPVARDCWRMTLAGDFSGPRAPGQFVQVQLPGFFLRRPISVCDWDENGLTLIYKTVGHGTEAMSAMLPGQTLDLLTGLGNGFAVREGERPLLVGGGVGVPPLYGLCKALVAAGQQPMAALGFATAEDALLADELRALGARVCVATADGSLGTKGFVTDAIRESGFSYTYLYACGPEPMLRAVYDLPVSGQFSFEERMACGFGACMGCSCKTKYGAKRICKDGPVLQKEEIVW